MTHMRAVDWANQVAPPRLPPITFTVIEEVGDDPESNCTYIGQTAAEIRVRWPLFAALFPDGDENSLVFNAELHRWTIKPEYD